MGWWGEQREAAKKHVQFDSRFGNATLVSGKVVMHQLSEARRVTGAVAEFESGVYAGSRTTLTRVAAGAIIAGPVGAIVGGMFKKDQSKVYVTITWPDGAVAIAEGPAKDESDARRFAQRVTAAGAAYDA